MTWRVVNGPVFVLALIVLAVIVVVAHELWRSVRSEWRKFRR